MQINLAKTIASQPAVAFATISNITEWPDIIDSIRSVELLTPGPIRVGPNYERIESFFGRESIQQMEVETLERSHRLRLFVEHPDLHYELDHLIDAVYGGGCRVMLIFRSRPKSATGQEVYPLVKPFMEISLRDELERDLSDLAPWIAAHRTIDDG